MNYFEPSFCLEYLNYVILYVKTIIELEEGHFLQIVLPFLSAIDLALFAAAVAHSLASLEKLV